ncbi:MAG: hypothetical protein J6Z34_04360 [Clostridia bacterium]|nr:hypothetical protein [Clostridia bacterium]
MTNRKTYKGFRSIIALIAVFVLSFALLLVTACKGGNDSGSSADDSSSSSSSSTVSDTHTLLNGNFEYYAEGDSVTFPYSSSIKWSNSRGYIVSASSEDYAPSSTAKSDIISTGDKEYKDLLETKFGSTDDTLATFLKGDNAEAFNPHSPSYFGFTEKDADVPETSDNDRVLMIHNRISASPRQGTAQYFYTSGSTLTLAAGEYGKLTVWVNTYGLDTEMVTEDYGAYVKVVNKPGSEEAAPVYVKNINTNGQWVKAEIFLEAGKLSSSTYTVYLGLGLGSANLCAEYAEGFAFFDDVTFETIDEADYAVGVDAANAFNSFEPDAEDNAALVEGDMNFSLTGTAYVPNAVDDDASYTTLKYSVSHAVEMTANDAPVKFNANVADADKTFVNSDAFNNAGHKTQAEGALASSVGFKAVSEINVSDEKAFLGSEDKVLFDDADKFLYFDFNAVPSSVTVITDKIDMPKDGRLLFTFWAKTKVKLRTSTGLTVTLRDRGAAGVDENDYKTTDIIASLTEINSENNGWKQYSVLIQNTAKEVDTTTGVEGDDAADRSFDLKITFGPTDSLIENKSFFPEGYALVGNFEYANLSEDVTSIFSVSNSVSLSAEILNTHTEPEGNYFFSGRKGQIESGQLTQPLSAVQPYGAEHTNSGIFNTQYLKTVNGVDLVDAMDKPVLPTDAGNEHVQALAIGDTAGYYTGKYTVSAGSVAKITVKLAVFGGATAHVNVLDRTKAPSGTRGYDILTLAKDDIKNDNLVSGSLENDISFSRRITDTSNKWVTVTFYVQAGTEDITFGVEVGNYVNRDDMWAETPVAASGLVVINSVDVSTSAAVTVSDLDEEAELNGAESTSLKFSYRADSYDVDNKDTPVTTEIAGETENVTSVNENDLTFESVSADEYVLYANFLVTNFEDKVYVVVPTETDTEDETSSSASASAESDALPVEARWLYISSIVIALALIVVLGIIIVRYFVKKSRAKRVKTVSYYDKDSRERANEKIRANKAKRAEQAKAEAETEPEEEFEETEEYDYDAAANIDENEVPAEEATEDAEPEESAVEETPAEAEEPAVEDAPVEEAPVTEEAPAEESPVETPAEQPVEEAPAEIPAEETPVEETPAEVPAETPAEPAPVEETPAEDAEEKKED